MADLRATIESVFRQESGIIIAGLIRVSGSFDLAEEAMQEAFAAALTHWPTSGVPQNPAAWITTVARRKIVDFVRREVGRLLRGDYRSRFLCASCLTRLVRASLSPTYTKGQIERGVHTVFRLPGALRDRHSFVCDLCGQTKLCLGAPAVRS